MRYEEAMQQVNHQYGEIVVETIAAHVAAVQRSRTAWKQLALLATIDRSIDEVTYLALTEAKRLDGEAGES